MSKTIRLLGVLFIIQLIVVAALLLQKNEPRDKASEQVLLPLVQSKQNQIDKIVISGESKTLTLTRPGAEWILPDYYDFPVAENQVSTLIQKLADFKEGWPVATTAAAAKRFKVSDDDFERKLELYQGETLLETLYVGSSPGFRKVHVRKPDDSNIYDVTFSAFDASIKIADWRDTSLLRLEEKGISNISTPGFSLAKEGDVFVLDGLAEGETIAQTTVADYVQNLAALNTVTVLGKEASATFNQEDPLLLLTVENKVESQSATLEYRLSRSSEGQFILKRSDLPFYFTLHDVVAKSLIVSDKKYFLIPPEEETAEKRPIEEIPAEVVETPAEVEMPAEVIETPAEVEMPAEVIRSTR
ncbi:MAG: DUF4340 domain-containing protein [Gammaproteobacteria bacterium]|nr:DUF4340 domain-containing protein [Gammaproteobacteria bacterium]